MGLFKACVRRVHRTFRRIERFADRLTGAVGPAFVTFAVFLISVCLATFIVVIFPDRFFRPEHSQLRGLLGAAWCGYVVYCICFHYFMSINTHPGSPTDPAGVRHTRLDVGSAALSLLRIARPNQQQPFWEHAGAASENKAMPTLSKKQQREQRRQADERICKKCPAVNGLPQFKPERAHHCKICRKCYLKFDHHCPWINSCVGLYNERYFLLFMVYLTVACFCVTWWGFRPMLTSLDIFTPWDHFMPRVCTVITWVICVCIGCALFVMLSWQLWIICKGETSVEWSDNDYYRKLAASKGKIYLHPYDFGVRKNLADFFNVGPNRYPFYTIALPWPVPPSTDGWTWPKRENWDNGAVAVAEELTDDDDDDDDLDD